MTSALNTQRNRGCIDVYCGTFTILFLWAMDLYLRLTGLTAAGVALLLTPDDVSHLTNIHALDLLSASQFAHARY